jgi:large subunit ribosomal protein L29
MKFEQLKTMSKSDLHDKLIEIRMKQLAMRVKKTSGSHSKTHEFGQARKLIARIKTILTQINGKDHG